MISPSLKRCRYATAMTFVAASIGWAAPAGAVLNDQKPWKAGEVVAADVELGHVNDKVQTTSVCEPGASFIKIHFEKMDLTEGVTVTVSDTDQTMSHTYPGAGFTTDGREGFWALSVLGDTAVITLEGLDTGLMDSGVRIDSYAWGYPVDPGFGTSETVCGGEDRLDVACYEQSHPIEFEQASAVALLLLTTPQGTWSCTAWRIGTGPHLMTNWHCLELGQADLDATEFRFNYQRPECGSGFPSGVRIVSGDELVVDHEYLDFSLVTVEDIAAVDQFGVLELDLRVPELGEEIYIPGHPPEGNVYYKRYALESDMNGSGYCEIDDAIRDGGWPNSDTGYYCDSSRGQSGSPVIARSSRKVIALHHWGTTLPCGGDEMNAGVRIDRIWPFIKAYLPVLEDGFERGDMTRWSGTVP